MVLDVLAPGGCIAQFQTRHVFRPPASGKNKPSRGLSGVVSGNPLRIKIYYILCSSAESRLIIVGRRQRCKGFLMHTKAPRKAAGNQRARLAMRSSAPTIHRESTSLSTVPTFMRATRLAALRCRRFSRRTYDAKRARRATQERSGTWASRRCPPRSKCCARAPGPST